METLSIMISTTLRNRLITIAATRGMQIDELVSNTLYNVFAETEENLSEILLSLRGRILKRLNDRELTELDIVISRLQTKERGCASKEASQPQTEEQESTPVVDERSAAEKRKPSPGHPWRQWQPKRPSEPALRGRE